MTPTHRIPRNRIRAVLALLTAAVLTAACSGPAEQPAPSGAEAEAAITVQNCGETLSLEQAPERVVMLDSSAVTMLAQLGVLDRVIARGGEFPAEYYSDEISAALADIPALSSRTDASGHVLISREVVTAEEPDLIIGSTDTVNRSTMTDVPLIQDRGYCGEIDEADFADIYTHVRLYATVFDVAERGEDYVAELEQQVAELKEAVAARSENRTVAVLYPAGPVTYAYGRSSMSHPIVTTAGLRNVYEDTSERVFEVTAEDLAGRNPDVIIVLRSEDPQAAVDHVHALPGAGAITAVQNDRILSLGFNFAEPPTPLAISGLRQVVDYLEAHP